jgi:hypothetical protein
MLSIFVTGFDGLRRVYNRGGSYKIKFYEEGKGND